LLAALRAAYAPPVEIAFALNQAQRFAVTHVIGRLNALSEGLAVLMLGPGRWGSRDTFLGIPVMFSEINHVTALCEVVAMHDHLVPDDEA